MALPPTRTLIFARNFFSRVHIFAAYIFAPEALGINFRDVSIFAWWLFSFFFSRKSIGSNFRACLHAHKYSQKFDMLACIHTKWASLFSRVVIFAGGNFRIFSRRENYNSAKINVLNPLMFCVPFCVPNNYFFHTRRFG